MTATSATVRPADDEVVDQLGERVEVEGHDGDRHGAR